MSGSRLADSHLHWLRRAILHEACNRVCSMGAERRLRGCRVGLNLVAASRVYLMDPW